MSLMKDIGKELENNIENEDNMTRCYELGYLLVPTIPEDEVGAMYGNLKELILNHNGVVVSDDMPRMIDIAYEMTKVLQNVRHRFKNAYFGWIKFEMNTTDVLNLKKQLDLDLNIIRFLILKTVKENTIASKRFIHKDNSRRKIPGVKKAVEGEDVEINKEEIDKEIDAMVAA